MFGVMPPSHRRNLLGASPYGDPVLETLDDPVDLGTNPTANQWNTFTIPAGVLPDDVEAAYIFIDDGSTSSNRDFRPTGSGTSYVSNRLYTGGNSFNVVPVKLHHVGDGTYQFDYYGGNTSVRLWVWGYFNRAHGYMLPLREELGAINSTLGIEFDLSPHVQEGDEPIAAIIWAWNTNATNERTIYANTDSYNAGHVIRRNGNHAAFFHCPCREDGTYNLRASSTSNVFARLIGYVTNKNLVLYQTGIAVSNTGISFSPVAPPFPDDAIIGFCGGWVTNDTDYSRWRGIGQTFPNTLRRNIRSGTDCPFKTPGEQSINQSTLFQYGHIVDPDWVPPPQVEIEMVFNDIVDIGTNTNDYTFSNVPIGEEHPFRKVVIAGSMLRNAPSDNTRTAGRSYIDGQQMVDRVRTAGSGGRSSAATIADMDWPVGETADIRLSNVNGNGDFRFWGLTVWVLKSDGPIAFNQVASQIYNAANSINRFVDVKHGGVVVAGHGRYSPSGDSWEGDVSLDQEDFVSGSGVNTRHSGASNQFPDGFDQARVRNTSANANGNAKVLASYHATGWEELLEVDITNPGEGEVLPEGTTEVTITAVTSVESVCEANGNLMDTVDGLTHTYEAQVSDGFNYTYKVVATADGDGQQAADTVSFSVDGEITSGHVYVESVPLSGSDTNWDGQLNLGPEVIGKTVVIMVHFAGASFGNSAVLNSLQLDGVPVDIISTEIGAGFGLEGVAYAIMHIDDADASLAAVFSHNVFSVAVSCYAMLGFNPVPVDVNSDRGSGGAATDATLTVPAGPTVMIASVNGLYSTDHVVLDGLPLDDEALLPGDNSLVSGSEQNAGGTVPISGEPAPGNSVNCIIALAFQP